MGVPTTSKTQDEVNRSEDVSEDMRATDTHMKEEGVQPSDSTIVPSQVQRNHAVLNTNQDPEKNAAAAVVPDDTVWSVWTTTEKKLIILAAGIAAFFSPISAQIYFPALNTIAGDLKVSNTLINLTITTYMVSLSLSFTRKSKTTYIDFLLADAGTSPNVHRPIFR
jgi:hypothetical protein